MQNFPAVLLAAVMLAFANPTLADGPSCSDRASLLHALSDRYAEAPVALGLSSDGAVMEILVSEKTGTWTILITWPDAKTCILTAGESWELLGALKGRMS